MHGVVLGPAYVWLSGEDGVWVRPAFFVERAQLYVTFDEDEDDALRARDWWRAECGRVGTAADFFVSLGGEPRPY